MSERRRFDAAVARAGSPDERDYLMKALAAGRSVDEVEVFADRIRGRTRRWMDAHLRLTARSTGSGAQQRFLMPHGIPVAEAVRGEIDPVHALAVNDAPPAPAADVAPARSLDALGAVAGIRFETKLDLTPAEALATIDAGLAKGLPVPIVLGDRKLVVTGHLGGGTYAVHDPWEGRTTSQTGDRIAADLTAVESPSLWS